jgi:glycosyltransferase involved in cell wall biosynthesis
MRLALIVEQALAPVPGGTGRYAVELAGALAGLDGVDVTGWTAWHRGTAAATVPRVRGPRRLPLPGRPLIAAWERGLGPVPSGTDLVHATTLLLPPRRGRPLVVTIHDAVPWTHPETLTPRGVRWHRAMAQRAARTADAIVVPSAATARALAGVLDLERAPEVVPLGVTALPAPADAAARLERLGLTAGGYVLSLATLEPRKGLDVLIRAMATPAAPALPLVLVGAAGWGGVDPRAVAAEAGLAAGRLRVLGHLGDDDLAAVLGAATVLTVPSRVEGFGLPVVEGMAAGVPVVTSRDDALVEVGGPATLPSDTGDPDALADALARVCTDTALRASMIAAGRGRAAGYTWRATAERQAEIYRRLL